MKQNLHRILMRLAACLLAAALLTACGTAPSSQPTASSDTASAGSAPASAADSTSNARPVTLTVFDGMTYGLDRYEELIRQFEADHPGVTVEAQHVSNDFKALLASRINSGDIPDVFSVQVGSQAQEYYEYASDWSDRSEALEKFNESALATGRDAQGRIMSLPWNFANMGIIYNKEVFRQAGITKLPETISELEDTCKTLQNAGFLPFGIAAKETWVLNQLSTHFMMDKQLDAEGVVSALQDGSLTLEQAPNFRNFFKILDLAVEYGPAKPLELDWETCENMLANGECAMIHMGDWAQAALYQFNPDAKLAFLPCPVSENPQDVTLLSSVSWTWIASAESENLDLAREFILYILTSDQGLEWSCEAVGSVQGAKTDRPASGELANDAAQYIRSGKTNGWIHTIMPQAITGELGSLYQSYLLGDLSVDEAIRQAQQLWDSN